MTYNFHVGQKVVCVDDTVPLWVIIGGNLRRGSIYTIEKIGPTTAPIPYRGESLALFLLETKNDTNDGKGDLGYAICRFRPLETKAIQLFRSIAQGVTDGKPIVPDEEDVFERAMEALIFKNAQGPFI